MGRNKAFLEIDGQRMIDRTVATFKKIFDEVILVTNTPTEYFHLAIQIVTDLIPKKGSLGGIFTGLFYSSSQYIFVAACDMPFLNDGFIDYMVSQSNDFDVVVPHPVDGLQPLHAIYSKRCSRHIETLIASNDLKIARFYSNVRVREITPSEMLSFDPEQAMFFNINTPEQLAECRKRHSC